MARFPVADLTPGMRLSRAVHTDSGMVLIGEGTELTEAHINRLRTMDIESVQVELERRPDKTREEMLAELDERFRKSLDSVYMKRLKKIFVEHIDESFNNNGNPGAAQSD